MKSHPVVCPKPSQASLVGARNNQEQECRRKGTTEVPPRVHLHMQRAGAHDNPAGLSSWLIWRSHRLLPGGRPGAQASPLPQKESGKETREKMK